MTQVIKSSLQDVNEIVVAIGTYEMSVPSGIWEKVETLEHGLGKKVYYTYTISFDNEYYYAHPGDIEADNENALFMFTDENLIYFQFLWRLGGSSSNAFTAYFKYKLYILEQSNA